MAFHVGQKVVCVNDTPLVEGGDLSGLKKGRIYTVREVGLYSPLAPTVPCIRIKEITNRPKIKGVEWPYREYRFKPLEERKTDISVFERLLVPNAKITETVE